MALLGLMMAISCEERLSTERIGSQSNGPSIKVRVPGTNALMTKAADASAIPTRVFGNEDDDFTITEYVYDMNAMGPMTKGREIVTSGTSGHPINQNGESFGVLAYYETDGLLHSRLPQRDWTLTALAHIRPRAGVGIPLQNSIQRPMIPTAISQIMAWLQ